MTPDAPIFSNAMWRTGSTYLASCFARSDRYLLFYEPCHEAVGRRPSAARTRDRSRDRNLRHPQLEDGYFGSYELTDPQTGKPLRTLHAPDLSVRSVYGETSDRAIAFFEALDRAARASGRIAYLGFCRSGTQAARAIAEMGGRPLHLWRAPREQFASYDWPRNDYFMAGTVLQLAFSRRYGPLARALAPALFASLPLRLARMVPDRRTRDRYRLVRATVATLDPARCYALFYLSWLICFRAGQAQGGPSFSLTELAEEREKRNTVADVFRISFDDLRPTPAGQLSGIDYDRIEADVSARLRHLPS